ncbi:hypothetical protein M8J76_005611 [Diaphorina citri]|nr:hypothetical protein M8J76_005611 [Diaphorina citri]
MKKKQPSNKKGNGFEEWGGYMEAKKRKLEEQFELEANSDSRGGIFQGVAIFVNGYTIPSAEELKALMMLHGGIYHHYESSRTTHIIASNLPHTKIKKLKPGDKIIKPEWIVDSISAGKLLDHKKYLLYTGTDAKPLTKLLQKSYFENTEAPCCSKSLVETSSHTSTVSDSVDNTEESKSEAVNSEESKSEAANPIESKQETVKTIESKLETVNISAPKPQASSTKNASNEDFLGEFYNKSRLHHLSTMGSMFKQYVNELREKHDGVFRGIEAIREWKTSLGITEDEDLEETFSDNPSPSEPEPVIMHIDMDCFFVSVGIRHHPELQDEPVAVAHGKGNSSKVREGVDRQAEFDIYRQRTMNRMGLNSENHTRFNKVNSLGEFDSMSEIASCNYKAREYGLGNGMFVGHALKKCPNLKIVPYDFEGYKEVSYCLYNLIASLTLNIEAVSCDEMYVDCSQLLQELSLTPLQFASYLRETIAKETGCTCSTGFGSNKLQARLATKKAKPNGQFHLTPQIISDFMLNIPLSDLPGVGHSLLFKLNSLGAQTCGDLQNISLKTLQNEVGNKNGLTLYKHCRGEDDKELTFEHQRKSVSAEVNYGIRFQNNQEMETFLKQLAGEVEKRLEEVKMKGKCITLKLMVRSAEAPREASKFLGHGVCDYITKSSSLPMYISQASQILKEVLFIVNKLKVDPVELRGIGIQVSKLEHQSKTLATIDTFFTNKGKPPDQLNNPRPGPSNSTITPGPSNSTLPPGPSNSTLPPGPSNSTLPPEPSNSTLLPGPSNSNAMSSPKKLIFVPDSELKSPKRKTTRSPRKKSPKKVGDMKMYLMKAQAPPQVPEDFDKSVFEALPDDIKREVLKSTHEQLSILKTSTETKESTPHMNVVPDNLDESFLNALPEDIRQEVLDDLSRQQSVLSREQNTTEPLAQDIICADSHTLVRTPSPSPILDMSTSILDTTTSHILSSNVSLQEMRTMLREWMCESQPEPSDIEMFSEYLSNLVEERHLNPIVILLRFLRRHVGKKESTVWAEAYQEMLSCVQSAMKHKYGHELRI